MSSKELTIDTKTEGDLYLHVVSRGLKIIEYRSPYRHISEAETDYLHWLIDRQWGVDKEGE